MLVLKQPLIWPFFRYKSATTGPIDPYNVSNSKLKPDLCNCVKLEIVESAAPPRLPHKQGTNFLGYIIQKARQQLKFRP